MDLANIATIKNILRTNNLLAKKWLGQHFLVDGRVVERLIKSANLNQGESVLEIGPGIGIISKELLKISNSVIAVEKDLEMARVFKGIFKDSRRLRVIARDILKLNPEEDLPKNYKIISNLPFNITSPVIRYFLETKNKPISMVLIIQKEVAERIVAEPGKMSILAVSVQFYAKPEVINFVSNNSFWPKPKVDSAIIKIVPRVTSRIKGVDEKIFFRLVKIGFSSPRKKLANNLADGFQIPKERVEDLLKKVNIHSQERPQDLRLEAWLGLYKVFDECDIL